MEPEVRTDLQGDAKIFCSGQNKESKEKRLSRRDKRGRSLSHPFSKK